MECFAGVQAGQTYAQIGKKLGITERTVTFHLHNGRDKLGASTVTHAITMALQQGLLSNDTSHHSSEKPPQSDETTFPPQDSALSPTDLAMTQWKVSQMSEMISAIAHHWRQPLTVISLSIQNILEEYKANELTAASLEEISAIALASVGKMSQTIFDLTAHSYLCSGLHSTCALRETMETVCFLYPELEALQIEVTGYFLKQRPKPVHLWRASNRRLMVNLPMAGLRQVIFNLIANARDAIIAKRRVSAHHFAGSIRIKVKVVNDFVAISVEDNGGGIQSGALKRIFEPFFTTKERCVGTGIISGSGLGLYQAKLLVEAQAGGTIYAKNGTNGAVITIALPIAENTQ
jgi:signal transduction histidine kinase